MQSLSQHHAAWKSSGGRQWGTSEKRKAEESPVCHPRATSPCALHKLSPELVGEHVWHWELGLVEPEATDSEATDLEAFK